MEMQTGVVFLKYIRKGILSKFSKSHIYPDDIEAIFIKTSLKKTIEVICQIYPSQNDD